MLWMLALLAFEADLTTAEQVVAANSISSAAAVVSSEVSEPVVPVAGDARAAGTANFIVYSQAAGHDAREVAIHCERWLERLQNYWCGEPMASRWSPRCEVVLYGTSQGYLAAVGRGGSQTAGSSLILHRDGKVASRRIDLRGDGGRGIAALPHEMTHVLLADLLDGQQPPRWADEGIAVLADSYEKQSLHQRDFQQALSTRQSFRIGELLLLDGYPQPQRVAAFYGQSASLAAFLARRDDPAKFVQFIRRSQDAGYDRALHDVYRLDGIAELERLWNEDRYGGSNYHGLRLTLDSSAGEDASRVE